MHVLRNPIPLPLYARCSRLIFHLIWAMDCPRGFLRRDRARLTPPAEVSVLSNAYHKLFRFTEVIIIIVVGVVGVVVAAD